MDLSRYNFRSPNFGGDYVLEQTWSLRTKHNEKATANDIIMKRPPFFRPDCIDQRQALQAVTTNFPGLPSRSHYSTLPTNLANYFFPLHIYDLEGCLRRREHPSFELIQAGMYHYAQYVRNMVWICNEEVAVSQGVVEWPRGLSTDLTLRLKRCWFFVIKDNDLQQYSLAWFDLKHGAAWYVDSRADDSATSKANMDCVGEAISKLAQKVMLRYEAQPIRRVAVTPRPPQREYSGLYLLENFRMRILEAPDQNKAIRCESGLQDWTKAIHMLSRSTGTSGNPHDDLMDRHLYTYSIELSALPGRLRWPDRPTVAQTNWQEFLNNAYPCMYRSNASFLPDNGTSLPLLSNEFDHFESNRSESLLRPEMYRASRASTADRSVSPALPSGPPSRGGSIPRLAEQFGLAMIAGPREPNHPTKKNSVAGGWGTGTPSILPSLRQQVMFDVGRETPVFYSARQTPEAGENMDYQLQAQVLEEARRGSNPPDILPSEGVSRQSSVSTARGSAAPQQIGTHGQAPGLSPHDDDPFRTPQPQQHSAQPSPVVPPAGTPSVALAQPAHASSGGPQRASRSVSSRHSVPYEWGLRNSGERRARTIPEPPPLQSPYTSLWAGDNHSMGGLFRPTHTANWRGFFVAKDQERREREIAHIREQNQIARGKRGKK